MDDFLAQATPEAKLKLIREHQAGGKLVAMTGDGTNDAPAHAQADVVDDLKMDLTRRLVTVKENPISLTPTEYEILRLLLQNAGKVLTHHQLLRQVWGSTYETEMHILRVNISNLRRKIEPDPARPHYLITESGVVYRIRV